MNKLGNGLIHRDEFHYSHATVTFDMLMSLRQSIIILCGDGLILMCRNILTHKVCQNDENATLTLFGHWGQLPPSGTLACRQSKICKITDVSRINLMQIENNIENKIGMIVKETTNITWSKFEYLVKI